jgi:hypothetical protein
VSDRLVWTPRPDPALRDPLPPGLRPHRHTPDRLHGWVFLQQQVWVDHWGNEHEIDSMPADYRANVIGFCKQRAERIQAIVTMELLRRALLHLLGSGAAPGGLDLEILDRIARNGAVPTGWLHSLPLLRALHLDDPTTDRRRCGDG